MPLASCKKSQPTARFTTDEPPPAPKTCFATARSTRRTLGHHASVNIVNSSHVEHAALNADKACGEGTRLIYYMVVGEVLSRSFTTKDTHTPQGDLIVAFTNSEDSQAECSRRAMATGILLGFSSPCFTLGTDLILPAEMNGHLRELLRQNGALKQGRGRRVERAGREDDADDELTADLATVAAAHVQYATVYIPEVWVNVRSIVVVDVADKEAIEAIPIN